MNKKEFLEMLQDELTGLPQKDIDERIDFYSEIIDDRMEDGLTEEEAVSEIGTVDEIVSQIVADTPLIKIAKENIKQKRNLKVWEIILLALGSPVWFSLLIALFAVAFSLYLSLWSIIISLWAVFVSFLACGFSGVFVGTGFAIGYNIYSGIAMIAAGIVCSGLAILMFLGCKAATKATIFLTKKIVLLIKNCFRKKEVAK
ncbi:MAG: DUF1700 domain-containing protein [Ruminococcaceae bacterium]|nr:DUF1700 domain-containing protein [Oscillospiraceae bacterium]